MNFLASPVLGPICMPTTWSYPLCRAYSTIFAQLAVADAMRKG